MAASQKTFTERILELEEKNRRYQCRIKQMTEKLAENERKIKELRQQEILSELKQHDLVTIEALRDLLSGKRIPDGESNTGEKGEEA